MNRRRALSATSQMRGKIVLTYGGVCPISIFDYLYNKYYDIGGSALSPNTIDEEIYLEGFPDMNRLNGKVTRLWIRNENEVWLYTEESVSALFAAAVYRYSSLDKYCQISAKFTD